MVISFGLSCILAAGRTTFGLFNGRMHVCMRIHRMDEETAFENLDLIFRLYRVSRLKSRRDGTSCLRSSLLCYHATGRVGS